MLAELALSAGGLLRALQFASPALPIGAYAYSRGLEHAVHVGWVHDGVSARDWIGGVLSHSLASLDAPVLVRLHRAFTAGDHGLAAQWNNFLRASRESQEVALEDRQLGLALAKLLIELGADGAARYRGDGGYVTLFAFACVHFEVPCSSAVLAFLFACAESQVTAASRLVPLGQSDAQRALSSLLARIAPLCARALTLADDELGSFTPGLSLASALHETQYSRLYRS